MTREAITPDAESERALIDQLRAKMGPMLRSDDEARAMLAAIAANPATRVFADHHQPTSGREGE